ncbi:Eco57I restriction-modification methylase domain-containing protein [Peribacillus castrilensis]|uniref:site-specific DNA-methyltransferase (adenine-specific) n=1 Tax=Peribacillus simplex TaxID=1478 RepID=A0AAN2PJ27_9BACI|nr:MULTISPECIES: N-6 DNA methylase [Peribacillus]MCP1156121.1 BREX-1 system adenine-specific DNA-methyltransferase PglX [Peribacillus frigoritolerans]MCT1390709.1 BREX-1 system adenine-specific DNA-methyltransferase PglX [Peribacillus frigoritolerans]CEG33241.1 N-6 DNA methylase [Peribacillus simplex]
MDILGYSAVTSGKENWEIEIEKSTEIDSTVPDAILGKFNKDQRSTTVVVELKGPKAKLDLNQKRGNKSYGTPIDQAFLYASKYEGCKWIIVSNIYEIRVFQYGRSQATFERFILSELAELEFEFKRFHFLLTKRNLLAESNKTKSKVDELGEIRYKQQQFITNEFYTFYSVLRKNLWIGLIKNNPTYDKSVLLEKAQKILDRILFIRFCEDLSLLPPTTLSDSIEEGEKAVRVSIWVYLQNLFRDIDRGNTEFKINKFNGELFKNDPILDYLNVPNSIFKEIKGFFDYNFTTDLDVNILGHIFEQSINDIEELKKETSSTRKLEGIFYTPDFITEYIVEHSVGTWLENQKNRLGINNLVDWDKTEDKGWRKRYIQDHIDFWVAYREVLRNIKVIDPACGSGAFLNKAFDYLYTENLNVSKTIRTLEFIIEDQSLEQTIEITELIGIDKSILKNNIFGVDLNKESVEITKLSLWIKTANINEPLTALNENILVGNSVIDDNDIVKDRAFNWSEKFKEIMENGGFDVVIGNPPYIPIEFIPPSEKAFLQSKYQNYLTSKWDMSSVFIIKCSELLNENGYLSLIIPVTWQTGPNYITYRSKLFSENLSLERLINLPFNMFPDAYVDTCIFVANKNFDSNEYLGYQYEKRERLNKIKLHDITMDRISKINYIGHDNFKIFPRLSAYKLYGKIKKQLRNSRQFKQLGDITISTQGPVKSQYTYYNRPINENCFPFLEDGQTYRYSHNILKKNYIDLNNKKSLIKYYIGNPKIFMRRIINRQDRLMATIIYEDLVTKKDINPFILVDKSFHPLYILALLNSKLLSYIYINFSSIATKDDYRQTTMTELRELPIKTVDIKTQEQIGDKVNNIINNLSTFSQTRDKAMNLLRSEYGLIRLTNKINEFYDYPIQILYDELKNLKVVMDFKAKSELYDFFIPMQAELARLKQEIISLDNELDDLIYSLYSINQAETEVINDYFKKYKNESSLF